MRKLPLMVSLVAAGVAWGTTSSARADHDPFYSLVADRAETIVCESRDLQSELRYRFHDSALYRDLLSTNSRIRSKANYVRSQARPGRCTTTLARFAAELDELICRMDGLIDEANWRALRRLDPPLGSIQLAKARVSRMRFAIDDIRRALTLRRFEVGVPRTIGPYPWSGETRYDDSWPYDGARDLPYGDDGVRFRRTVTLDRSGVTLQAAGLSVHFGR